MVKNTKGASLIEVMMAAVIGSLIAGGTIMAFVLASKVTRDAVVRAEALGFATQTIERFRNRIACDDAWFDLAASDCNSNLANLDPDLPQSLVNDPDDTAGDGLPNSPFSPTTSALIGHNMSESRQYRMVPADCDGVSGADCYTFTVVVNWTPHL